MCESYCNTNWLSSFCYGFMLSPVPRPHPLTRRNDLMNQVEFLGLCKSVTKQRSKHFAPNLLKKGTGTQVKIINFCFCKGSAM